jgi:hypothetical protein
MNQRLCQPIASVAGVSDMYVFFLCPDFCLTEVTGRKISRNLTIEICDIITLPVTFVSVNVGFSPQGKNVIDGI